jgi:hypothetical protein
MTARIWELASAKSAKSYRRGGGWRLSDANNMTFSSSNNKNVIIFTEEHLVQIGHSCISTSNMIGCVFSLLRWMLIPSASCGDILICLFGSPLACAEVSYSSWDPQKKCKHDKLQT